MNSEKLLDIINCTLTDENIYELFKNHGYNESFENLQKDLTNLLDKFTATDDELSNVAGGKSNIYTKISSGILASIASFSGMNFVGAQTLKEEQSKSQRVLNNIKENGVNSAKKAAKFVVNNGGKIAGVGSLLVTWSLLCALIGRYTKEVPVVETKDMTGDEKNLIEFARGVLTKIYTDINSGYKQYFDSEHENYQDLQTLIEGSARLAGLTVISGDVDVGHLVEKLLPETKDSSTHAYIAGRAELIKYEKELIDLAKKLIDQYRSENVEGLKQTIQKLTEESAEQKQNLEKVEEEKKQLNEEMKSAEKKHTEQITELENNTTDLKNQLEQISGEKETMKKKLEDKDTEINNLKNEKEDLNKKLKLERDSRKAIIAQSEKNLMDQITTLNKQLAEKVENVSLDKWNGVGECYLAALDSGKKSEKLDEWKESNHVKVTDEILTGITDFFFKGQKTFTAPNTLPAPYQTGIFGKFNNPLWGQSYFAALTSTTLKQNFIDPNLWIKLFKALEKSGNPADVDLVFVLFQACRLAGWSFVPETICKALLEHYPSSTQKVEQYSTELRGRIDQLLDSCGLKLKYNGVYLKEAGDQQRPVFSR